eukprot:scaffold2550_cov153-Skeletonema_menzelii.AAC.34
MSAIDLSAACSHVLIIAACHQKATVTIAEVHYYDRGRRAHGPRTYEYEPKKEKQQTQVNA